MLNRTHGRLRRGLLTILTATSMEWQTISTNRTRTNTITASTATIAITAVTLGHLEWVIFSSPHTPNEITSDRPDRPTARTSRLCGARSGSPQ